MEEYEKVCDALYVMEYLFCEEELVTVLKKIKKKMRPQEKGKIIILEATAITVVKYGSEAWAL